MDKQFKEELKVLKSVFKAFAKEEDLTAQQEEYIKDTLMVDIYYEVQGRMGYNLDERRVADQGRVYVYTDENRRLCWYDYQAQLEAIYDIISDLDHHPDDEDYSLAHADVVQAGAEWIINRIGDPKEYYMA